MLENTNTQKIKIINWKSGRQANSSGLRMKVHALSPFPYMPSSRTEAEFSYWSGIQSVVFIMET